MSLKSIKAASLYIATLKGLALNHQHAHWISKGNDFYGNHLLFERLYNGVLENLDGAAEKFIGILGEECLDYNLQTQLLTKILNKYSNLAKNPIELVLTAERDFVNFSKQFYNLLEEEGTLTLGVDDFLMSVCSKREEAIYLLQQAKGSK